MTKNYDYLIIGGGLAGLQLALNIGRDRFFEQKTVAVIDPSLKVENDKTWCFWEPGKSEWDKITYKSWNKGSFKSLDKDIKLELDPYNYKMVRSIDFYEYVKSILNNSPNITFLQDEIENIDEASSIAFGKQFSYSALHIFDSRVSPAYFKDSKYTKIFQHFKGWMIKTEKPEFDPSFFIMMDFRMKYKNSTSFMYSLPVSETEALVEFTFFTPYLTEDENYLSQLKKYIEDILRIKNYSITETEKGVIPMTDFPFHKSSTSRITKIGTAGSWVKASTGYSFKNTEKKVQQIIANIKKGANPSADLLNKKFRWYDAIFLDVLSQKNELGEEIFTNLYSRNSPQEIFRYLDEETSIKEDLRIMSSLYHPQFLKSFFRKTF